ncbi:reverse transcriptase domain-containing protein [Tanacetum coccineum]
MYDVTPSDMYSVQAPFGGVTDCDTPDTPPLQDLYEVTVARWRSRVAAHSSPPSPPTKWVGPLPTHRLALSYSADYSSSDHFTSNDSSRDSLSDSSPVTSSDSHSNTSFDSSARHSSSGHPISDSLCDSPTAISMGPSRKRCWSPTLSVSVASPVYGALSPGHANILPPRKRIRDYNSVTDFEVSSEEGYVPYVPRKVARGKEVRVEDGTATEEEADSSARGTIEIEVDRVTHPVVSDDTAKTVREYFPELRDQGHRIIVTSQQSVAMSERIGSGGLRLTLGGISDIAPRFCSIIVRVAISSLGVVVAKMPTATRTGMTQDAINELIAKRMEEVLKVYDATRNPGTETEMENEQQDDNVDTNANNGNGNGNGNGNPNVNNRVVVPVARECTYQDFMKCQPLNFKGTKGVVGLTRLFKKMETVFHISNCPPRTVRVDVAYSMTWKALMKLMTEMVPKEEDQVKKYIGGLPDNIQGNVIAVEPTRLQDAISIANNLMDQKLKGYAIKNAENKRRSRIMLKEEGTLEPCHTAASADCTTKGCRAPVGNQMGNTCYECGRPGHYRNECPKWRNQNRGNKIGNKNKNNEAKARAYAIGGGGANPDSNVVMDVHDLRSVETKFPAIVFNDELSSEKTLSCEPMVSSLNNNEIHFRISFDESDDKDYTTVFDKNSFSYKIISANDLKTDSENDNEKVNMPSFQSPEPTVSYFDDLDFFKDFKNEFPAIVYNDALTSKSDSSTEPVEIPHRIDEFDVKDETSMSKYDEEEQNDLYFNDLFSFNIIYPDDLKSDKDSDDN